jgi:ketosteroid isomerase-like protein
VSENRDLVRSIFAAWERGDYSSIEWAHPEIEWVLADGPSPGTQTGLAGMAAGWREYLTTWEGYRGVVDEFRELDNDRVLALTHRSGRGKTSGLELGHMAAKGAGLFFIKDAKVTKLVVYFDRDRAFADLGLKE